MLSQLIRVFSTESTEWQADLFVRQILVSTEALVWIKRPSRHLRLDSRERSLMTAIYGSGVVALLIVASIIASFLVQVPQKAPAQERLLIVFVLVALFGSEFLHRAYLYARRRNHFFYVLTTKRVLVLDPSVGRIVRDLDLRTIDYPRAVTIRDGVGTVTFGPPPVPLTFWNRSSQNGDEFLEGIGVKKGPPALKLVDNVDEVIKDILLARIAALQLEQSSESPTSQPC